MSGLSGDQQQILSTILSVGQRMGANKRALKAGVEAGLVESGLRNLAGGDRDSVGVFQQRPSQGWGTPSQIRNVTYAAQQFFRHAIPLQNKFAKSGDLAAAVQRPAPQYAGRYGQQSRAAEQLLGGGGAGGTASASSPVTVGPPGLSVSGSSGTQLAAALTSLLQPQQRQQVPITPLMAPSFAAHPVLAGTSVPQSGGPAPPASSDALSSALATIQGLSGPTARVTAGALSGGGTSPSGGGAGGVGGGRGGKIIVAPGAERAGVYLQAPVKSFLHRVSGALGAPITVTTGTNHNRLTVDGNVSDHWAGNAADIGVPVDSAKGDRIAATALEQLGVPRSTALQDVKHGGLWTITRGGVRYQVIWKTYEGGNHHNHVHIGAAPVG